MVAKMAKARKAFVKAYVTWSGHINNEFQYTKNVEKSKKVVDRNIQEVRRTAAALNTACEEEINRLEKEIDEVKTMQYHLPEFSYFPKTHYMSLLKETFPEIEEGEEKYSDRYLDRKYGDA